jgi:hypothetical protein
MAPAGGVLPEALGGVAVLGPLADGAVVLDDPEDELVVVPVAAEAMPAAPRPAPTTREPVISARRILGDLGVMVDSFLELVQGTPGAPSP